MAQAYDAGDPSATGSNGYEAQSTRAGQVDQPYQAYFDAPMPVCPQAICWCLQFMKQAGLRETPCDCDCMLQGREGYSAAGMQDFTQFYMGGIHPRPKQVRFLLFISAIFNGPNNAESAP